MDQVKHIGGTWFDGRRVWLARVFGHDARFATLQWCLAVDNNTCRYGRKTFDDITPWVTHTCMPQVPSEWYTCECGDFGGHDGNRRSLIRANKLQINKEKVPVHQNVPE
jgi:hypothetical protein